MAERLILITISPEEIIDELAYWGGRALTQDNVTWLYNGGNGRTYDELT